MYHHYHQQQQQQEQLYQQQRQQQQQELIQKYTNYYHLWTAREKQLKECFDSLVSASSASSSLTDQQQQQNVEIHRQWAKYYADESSRAAHFFYQNPYATTAPFELPPEPPSLPTSSSASFVIPTAATTAITTTTTTTTTTATPTGNSIPGGTKQQQYQQQPQQQHQPQQQQPFKYHYLEQQQPFQQVQQQSPAPFNNSNTFVKKRKRGWVNLEQQRQQHNDNNQEKRQQQDEEEFMALPSMRSTLADYPSLKQTMKSAKNNKSSKKNKKIHDNSDAVDYGYYGNSDFDKYMGKKLIGGGTNSTIVLDENDYQNMTVKGTSTTLEKEYLRLTGPPKPEQVRPLSILQEHLKNLLEEYYCIDDSDVVPHDNINNNTKTNTNTGTATTMTLLEERERTPQGQWNVHDSNNKNRKRRHDYLWFCSQLKAVRQDCTVQRIQGDFAADVYEAHARIALQEGDLNEYNQCQTQLKELYKNHCPSVTTENRGSNWAPSSSDREAVSSSSSSWKNQDEFIAYRLLYYVYLSTNEKYSGGSSDMFHIMLSLSSKQRTHPAIVHALQIREAVAFSDYLLFFRLHKESPNLGIFLTNLLVPIMRMRGLRRMAKAYRPSLDLTVCLLQLGWFLDGNNSNNSTCVFNSSSNNNNKEEEEVIGDDDSKNRYLKEGEEWLKACGAVLEGSNFITKDSEIHEPVAKKKSTLI